MNDDRRNAIVRLLDTRHEHLPEPVRRSESSTGFVHHTPARVSCPDCLANDRAMFGCETCGGRGYTEVKRERDPYATDAVVPYGLDGSRHELARERDRQIGILDQQLRPASDVDELADANAHPYAWERARAAMYRRYDYAALDRAIEWLRHLLPGLSLYGGIALGFLDVDLPDPLRVPGDQPSAVNTAARGRGADPRALEQRNVMVRADIDAGVPTAEVAASFGLSVRQVNNIVQQAAA